MMPRLRLSEGFRFASSGDGIINMALELPIQVSPFILLPHCRDPPPYPQFHLSLAWHP